MPQTTLSLAFIGSGPQLIACADLAQERGHRIVSVVSDCADVAEWARRKIIPYASLAEDLAAFLDREPFDYLLSIVNHTITSDEVLAMPTRGAINFHDSPLPAYAGFNATSWSIIDGRDTHAVTWHEMLADVDAGRVLIQRPIDISEDDTAFTLGVKCGVAGVESFTELLLQMENDSLEGAPQGGGRSFHFRSERPGAGVLDWSRPADELHRLVRGLTFGPDDNWMCLAKVGTELGLFTVGSSSLGGPTNALPGTVVANDGDRVSVATADGILTLHELEPLDDAVLAAGAPQADGPTAGTLLPNASTFEPEAVTEFDAPVTKGERFWVRRLRTLHAPLLASLSSDDPSGNTATQSRPLPEAWGGDSDAGCANVAAAFAALVARVCDEDSFDLGLAVPTLTPTLRRLFASVVPMHIDVHKSQSFGELREIVAEELARLGRRITYALDVTDRYGELRDLPVSDAPQLPIGLALHADASSEPLPCGQSMQLCIEGGEVKLRYDTGAMSSSTAETLLNRFDTLLRAALERPETVVSKLPLLTVDEHTKLLDTWQQTACDYDSDRCIHELFEAQVERTPDKVAVVFRGQELTFWELNARANKVAAELIASGVGTETLVGVCIRRSLDMMVGLLGILKAGGAYVPMDPAYPKERLGIMLEDSGAAVLLTQRTLVAGLPSHSARLLCIDEIDFDTADDLANHDVEVGPENLAYVIFTSGSTGRPKGVMVQHGNVSNFFTGMDARIGDEPGVLLAVTSISFDISVLELFWTLCRGFEVVIQQEADRATLTSDGEGSVTASSTPMEFGLFYFAADSEGAGSGQGAYRLLLEGARFADTHGFSAVWTPERHFHAFGGLYPNPAVTTAALAVVTDRIQLRAGSVVLPLHNPLRVAEDWSVIDNLSNGRVGLSFASGWHVNDFAFAPENYENRRETMIQSIATVRALWRGEEVKVKNGVGEEISVKVLPRPVQESPPVWLASAGNIETFRIAGRLGADVLTNMLGQDLEDLRVKFAAYREARAEAGVEGPGRIAVMLHTYVCEDTEEARRLAKRPFCNYLKTSFDLVKVAPWMFPAFRQPSKDAAQDSTFDPSSFNDEDMDALLDHAFDRYFDTAGLFGSPERALAMVEQLKDIGATECACLIDFGIGTDDTLAALESLNRLRILANPSQQQDASPLDDTHGGYSVAEQLRERRVTHMQCTPSMARMLVRDPEAASALGVLSKLMVGGEAFPDDLRDELTPLVHGEIINMYGPTETTIWSTTSPVTSGQPITIGTPIANTVVRILDANDQLVPIGTPGELCIGGAGVVRGYFGQEAMTADRFVTDPYAAGQRVYRTGDLARYRDDGTLVFLGRLDHQVKVNGYRIELGEIESVLGRHAGVHQSVVVARENNGVSQLVAYVVAHATGGGSETERVDHWQSLWDEAYKQNASHGPKGPDVRFDYSGWTSSYDGELLAHDEMLEWLDGCVDRILSLSPKRVLEIGCGTGMILYRLLPVVNHYTAVDLSPHALEVIGHELTRDESDRVTLVNTAAHKLDGLGMVPFDTVVINSVSQYFPSADYLRQVITRAVSQVDDGGHIFVGDVRSAAHEDAMLAALELHQTPEHFQASDIPGRIDQRRLQQGELLLSPAFFEQLVRDIDGLSAVEYELKRGTSLNEMSRFRYDVVLHVGTRTVQRCTPSVQPSKGPGSLDAIRELLAAEPAELWLTDVPNARLTREAAVLRELARGATGSVHDLRAMLDVPAHGVQPEALYALDDRYDVQLVWATHGELDRMDVVLRHRERSAPGLWPFPSIDCQAATSNQPTQPSQQEDVASEWRAHLRDYLPEYMVPGTFVVLPALPLTPNGKIDRKALPEPRPATQSSATEFVAPAGHVEQVMADVWKDMLGLEQIGVNDNIFDIGANSLLTVQANNRLSKALDQKISLVAMFRFPTIQSLARHLGSSTEDAEREAKRTEVREDRKKSAADRRRAARAQRDS